MRNEKKMPTYFFSSIKIKMMLIYDYIFSVFSFACTLTLPCSKPDYGNFVFELRKKDLKHFPALFKYDDNFKFFRIDDTKIN